MLIGSTEPFPHLPFVRSEAAAAQEQAEAERAAKFIAEAEVQAVSSQLEEARVLMEKERTVARKVRLRTGNSLPMINLSLFETFKHNSHEQVKLKFNF